MLLVRHHVPPSKRTALAACSMSVFMDLGCSFIACEFLAVPSGGPSPRGLTAGCPAASCAAALLSEPTEERGAGRCPSGEQGCRGRSAPRAQGSHRLLLPRLHGQSPAGKGPSLPPPAPVALLPRRCVPQRDSCLPVNSQTSSRPF